MLHPLDLTLKQAIQRENPLFSKQVPHFDLAVITPVNPAALASPPSSLPSLHSALPRLFPQISNNFLSWS